MIATKASLTTLGAASTAIGLAAPSIGHLTVIDHVMAALGITIPGPVFIAGLAFALAGGAWAFARERATDRRELVVALTAAILLGTVAAIAQQWAGAHVHKSVAALPPQVFMFVAGLSSRRAMEALSGSNLADITKGAVNVLFPWWGGKK